MTQTKIQAPFDLGVAVSGNKVLLFTNLYGFQNPFHVSISNDGFRFKGNKNGIPQISNSDGTLENTFHCQDFRVSKLGNKFYATYTNTYINTSCIAESDDLITWKKLGNTNESGVLLSEQKSQNQHLMYSGSGEIKLTMSEDFLNWENRQTVLSPRSAYFDKGPLKAESVLLIDKGMLLLYSSKEQFREGVSYAIGAALFDKNDPGKLLWRRDDPLFVQQEIDGKHVYPLGAVKLKERLLLYFGIYGQSVFAVHFENFADVFADHPEHAKPQLERHIQNPIIEPVLEHHWESQAAFNPAALYDDGKVHLVYRAMGNNTSFLGYASSSDGVTIDERHPEPVYYPQNDFDFPGKLPNIMYMSGGGYGGCEDPRLTKIEEDGKVYLTYVAYNGSDPPRVALSSISTEDFRNHNWQWNKAKLISPPGVVDKNACLFPEKINGKYAILHRIFPNILLDFVDDLDFDEEKFLKGEFSIAPSDNGWDSRKVGAGAPPIKTEDGWLLIYHAVDDKNDSQYKIGAMLLDLNDPTKVLYRSTQPILKPTEWYENDGYKAGVVYPCGAVVLNGDLYVYYGGADKVVCVAKRDLKEFLAELKSQYQPGELPKHTKQTVLQHYYA